MVTAGAAVAAAVPATGTPGAALVAGAPVGAGAGVTTPLPATGTPEAAVVIAGAPVVVAGAAVVITGVAVVAAAVRIGAGFAAAAGTTKQGGSHREGRTD